VRFAQGHATDQDDAMLELLHGTSHSECNERPSGGREDLSGDVLGGGTGYSHGMATTLSRIQSWIGYP
jgi:hypothetical protein